MNTLDSFLEQAWNDHADQPAGVAERLSQGLRFVQDDDGVMRLAALAHHVLGEHLGRWQEGLSFLLLLKQRAGGAIGAASIARCQASLALSAGLTDGRPAMTQSDRCRVSSMAASNLATSDAARSSTLLRDAVAHAGDLTDDDAGVRALAANGNNIAATLMDRAPLDEEPRSLMIRAAEVARTHWERAGSWLEVERAEYRLAMCWLAAGDPGGAQRHARRCESVVRQNGSIPLELFFAAEALCMSARALGDRQASAGALETARQAFHVLTPDDQAWCRRTLDKLDAT